MRKILFFIFVFSVCSFSYAGFFNEPVNFFGSTQTETKILHNKGLKKKPTISIWAQPMVMPDGSVQTYVPPPQVVSFLNNPTTKNAQAYLAWEKERIEKIAKATAILQEVSDEEKNPGTSSANVPASISQNTETIQKNTATQNQQASPFSSPTILFFAKQGCKYCAADELIMDIINKKYKNEIKFIGLWVGSKSSMPELSFPFHLSNGLEKEFRIGLYPGFIIYLPNKPEPVKLEGFVTGNQFLQFYQKIGGVL
ncbi:MAG: conjugal transfer protein TraF [Candidatus Omnitrophica bacterium]|nr:conjugal transfer protein TraF [Candidatus Omnitrophota bacterium]